MPSNPRGRSNGIIFYRGPSLIDGGPIVAVATGLIRSSSNQKTADMLQTWIIRADQPPIRAAATGADRSVCGDCSLRHGACYVTLTHGPRAVYSALERGTYPDAETEGWSWADGRAVRFGAYGDPAAVPAAIWYRIAARAARWTGYTHQWRQPIAQPLRYLLMASVDSEHEAWAARSAGWRTFRIRLPEEPLLPTESVCPASTEGGKRTACANCAQCDGARAYDVRANYAVLAHGSGAAIFRRSRLKVL